MGGDPSREQTPGPLILIYLTRLWLANTDHIGGPLTGGGQERAGPLPKISNL